MLVAWSAKPAGIVIHCAAFDWCQKFQVEPSKMLPLGLHGGGVPFAAKMRASLECLNWNILADKTGMRLLFATFAKSFGAGRTTWDAWLHICMDYETLDARHLASMQAWCNALTTE